MRHHVLDRANNVLADPAQARSAGSGVQLKFSQTVHHPEATLGQSEPAYPIQDCLEQMPRLPPAIKAGIVAMVAAAAPAKPTRGEGGR